MCCELLGLRRIKGRGSSRGRLHLPITNTCRPQWRGAYDTIQHRLLPPACILYLSTKYPSSSPRTAQTPQMFSSWPLLKCLEKKAGWHSAAPPVPRLINLLRHLMFSSRHRLERGRKPPKLFLATPTYLSLVHSRSNPSNSVTWSRYHLPLLLSLPVSRLCSSSRWRCTGSSPESGSRPPSVRSLWGPCTPGPSGEGLWKTPLLLHLFSQDALRANLDRICQVRASACNLRRSQSQSQYYPKY